MRSTFQIPAHLASISAFPPSLPAPQSRTPTGFLAPVLRTKLRSQSSRPTQRHGRYGRFETRLGACGGEEESPDHRCKEGREGRQCSSPSWCRCGDDQEIQRWIKQGSHECNRFEYEEAG